MPHLPSLRVSLLSVFFLAAAAQPAPGRIPKVYNALITSNQNLEPSKAYPVYQPVLHDPFGFSYQPVHYGSDFPLENVPPFGILPHVGPKPDAPNPAQPTEAPASEPPAATDLETPTTPAGATPEPPAVAPTTAAPPQQPKTESPIPLNQFGLPPQILPLGRIDPAYTGFTQLGPYPYPYPGLRLYPYDPFNLGLYSIPSIYPYPIGNVLTPSGPPVLREVAPAPVTRAPPAPTGSTPPPSDPNDLNILNYASKDPAIPNVPPPPLPQGGLQPDAIE